MHKMKVAIIGATGYGGVELMRILQQHPAVSVHSFHSSSQYGKPIRESYPHLQAEEMLQAIDAEKLANDVELVFTATPSGVSAKLVPELLEKGLKVIDLSGDFRLKNRSVYEKWYGKAAADDRWLQEAVYGLTEWLDDDLSQARLISNPGCYPTAALLGLAPLVKNGLIDEKSIIIDAKSGASGAGRNPSLATHFSELNDNLKIYKVNKHQHIPEIEQVLSSWSTNVQTVTFSAHLVPMTRGILATMYADAATGVTTDQLLALYRDSYNGRYFVRIRESGTYPSTKEVYGSNFCDLSVTYDKRTNRIMVVSVIDNLMKGAAGQAVQNMNVMLGLDEKTGLELVPVYP